MGIHENIERKGKEEIRDIVVLPIQWDAVYLIKNRKWVTKKFWQKQPVRRVEMRVENKTLGKHELLINGRFKGWNVYTALVQVMQH
jgi:hypothetical protein